LALIFFPRTFLLAILLPCVRATREGSSFSPPPLLLRFFTHFGCSYCGIGTCPFWSSPAPLFWSRFSVFQQIFCDVPRGGPKNFGYGISLPPFFLDLPPVTPKTNNPPRPNPGRFPSFPWKLKKSTFQERIFLLHLHPSPATPHNMFLPIPPPNTPMKTQ